MKDGNTVVYRKTLSRRRWRGYSRSRRKQGTHEIVRLESETTPDSESAGWFPSRVPQTQIGRSPELREGGVLEGLGGAQAHHGLGLDLDGLAGLRVAAHARLAVGFHRAADIGDDEFSRSALALSYRQFEELFKKHRFGLLRRAALFSNVRHDLRLAHRLCHLGYVSSSEVGAGAAPAFRN